MSREWDAVVVGSGPNGLAAAVTLARAGYGVKVVEGAETIGGGTRTVESTLPGFLHDECSAIHPTGQFSPLFRDLPLGEHGLKWKSFPVSVAHPLDAGPTPILSRTDETNERLGADASAWARSIGRYAARAEDLFTDLLAPPRLRVRSPALLARFGMTGIRSAVGVAHSRFRTDAARALFAGCAAHSALPLEFRGTAAFGMLFGVSALATDWACAEGGSRSITSALAGLLTRGGGEIETGRWIRSLGDVPGSRVVLFDLSAGPFAEVAGEALPESYKRTLQRFRYGPACFKADWALDGPIPWRDPITTSASTVHVGGTLEEIAASERDAWEGRVAERPFLIVCQQSAVDRTRAPEGKHTGYAYCHVPAGCDMDMTERIESQIERFAPGFRDLILHRATTSPAEFERLNPNLVGGAITGGAATLRQLIARPALRWNPYGTPNPRLFLCSASTPPGGGVHGMCGYFAAKAAIRRLRR